MNAVDKFVIYDDVQYMKGGWINRNRILEQNKSSYINVQLKGASANKTIREVSVNMHPIWRKKLLKRIRQVYGKYDYFHEVFPIIESCVQCSEDSLSAYLTFGLKEFARHLNIYTFIIESSTTYRNEQLTSYNRVLDICRNENADTYVNASGGRVLYDQKTFKQSGIDLYFLQENLNTPENKNNSLSIIDVMMRYGIEETRQLVQKGHLQK